MLSELIWELSASERGETWKFRFLCARSDLPIGEPSSLSSGFLQAETKGRRVVRGSGVLAEGASRYFLSSDVVESVRSGSSANAAPDRSGVISGEIVVRWYRRQAVSAVAPGLTV